MTEVPSSRWMTPWGSDRPDCAVILRLPLAIAVVAMSRLNESMPSGRGAATASGLVPKKGRVELRLRIAGGTLVIAMAMQP